MSPITGNSLVRLGAALQGSGYIELSPFPTKSGELHIHYSSKNDELFGYLVLADEQASSPAALLSAADDLGNTLDGLVGVLKKNQEGMSGLRRYGLLVTGLSPSSLMQKIKGLLQEKRISILSNGDDIDSIFTNRDQPGLPMGGLNKD